MIKYYNYTVFEAAVERIKYIFDGFDNIIVSVSSGKDSSVLYSLALKEARKRNRKIKVFFLDQEAEYEGTVKIMRKIMSAKNVIPMWYQVPIYMTNATSYEQSFLFAWGEGEDWVREKESIAIKKIKEVYPKRFYDFFDWLEKKQTEKTAFLIGLRSKESLNRFRAIMKNPGYKDILWSTKTASDFVFKFYPIYDWTFGDIWKYIADNNIPYNIVYDKMYCKLGKKKNKIRISNLIHEKSFRCLAELQEIEPETYEKLCKRLKGIHTASRYSKETMMYNNDVLPSKFSSWKEYRDYLLNTIPILIKYKEKMIKRFNQQKKAESIYQQQCKQILISDWENSVPINIKKESKEEFIKKWWDLL